MTTIWGRLRSQEIADIGEANMSAGETLVDFRHLVYARNIPADKYVLILSDHGMGWPGGWGATRRPVVVPTPSIPLSSACWVTNSISTNWMTHCRRFATAPVSSKFELIGLDACLMSHLEVYAALAPHANYAVASQETEPALGWAYAGFLEIC
jgi:hypothetical protein